MSNIAVSVIVPVYNVENYLEKCLDSLLNQTLKNIEIICINDGSKDNSGDILKKYASIDNRIIVKTQENAGLSAARNAGMEVAKGEYIGFVDSDDWVDLDYFEKLYNTAKQNNCDIAVAGVIRLNKFKRKYYLKYEETTITDNKDKKFELCDIPEQGCVWNKIYRTKFLQSLGLKFEEGIYYEDAIFSPQAVYYSKNLVTVPDVYYYYWRNSNSIVAKSSKKKEIDYNYAMQKAAAFIKEKNIDISSHDGYTKRFKIFNTSIFKIRKKGSRTQYILFNIFKFTKNK